MTDEAYPDGMEWRCSRCGFECGDDGPDRCPNDGVPLARVLMRFPLRVEEEA